MDNQNSNTKAHSFSLWVYLLIVFGVSWPFQFASAIWGRDLLWIYIFNAGSMCMVTVGTFIAGRYVFCDGFAMAGWYWGRLKHYLLVIGLILLLWLVPTVVDLLFGTISLPGKLTGSQIIWVFVMMLNFIPCFGEEFGWRGYMLPHLARRFSPRKAVLIHAVIWWAWHLPLLAFTGWAVGMVSAEQMGVNAMLAGIIGAAVISLASAIPAILHGVVIAYIWVGSGSLAVATLYHLAYDGVRDSIQTTIGNGPIAGLWVVIILSLLGIIMLWKGNWKSLESNRISPQITEIETK